MNTRTDIIRMAHTQQRRHRALHSRKRRNRRMALCVISFFLLLIATVVKVSAVNQTVDPQEKRYKYYTNIYVGREDTLWDISRNYITEEYPDMNAYMNEVMAINHLTDKKLSYGTTICIPYYSSELK